MITWARQGTNDGKRETRAADIQGTRFFMKLYLINLEDAGDLKPQYDEGYRWVGAAYYEGEERTLFTDLYKTPEEAERHLPRKLMRFLAESAMKVGEAL